MHGSAHAPDAKNFLTLKTCVAGVHHFTGFHFEVRVSPPSLRVSQSARVGPSAGSDPTQDTVGSFQGRTLFSIEPSVGLGWFPLSTSVCVCVHVCVLVCVCVCV